MRLSRWLRNQDVRTVFGIIAVIVVPAVFTLKTVTRPLAASDVTNNPTPFGYTVSLLIYLVPVVTLYWWFARRCDERDGVDYRRSAYRRTLLTLIPAGFLLDIVLGHEFFTFTNTQATLAIVLPAIDFSQSRFVRYIPIEEFAFYTLGFMAILSVYVWCDEYWLEKYNVPDYEVPPRGNHGLPPFIAQLQIRAPLLISLALVAAACVYKWQFAEPDDRAGFPLYFTFLVLASLFPAILLFRSTRRFINWRAVSFTMFWVLLTSLIWEATLASPYGWWGYKPRPMTGLYVGAWFKLPIEAVLLWLSATFTTVTVYETYKILISMKRVCGVDTWTAIFGPRSVSEWAKEQLRPAATGLEQERDHRTSLGA